VSSSPHSGADASPATTVGVAPPAAWAVPAEISADALDKPQRLARSTVALLVFGVGALCAGGLWSLRSSSSAAAVPTATATGPATPASTPTPPPTPAPTTVVTDTNPSPPVPLAEAGVDDGGAFDLKELPARRKAKTYAAKGKAKLDAGNDDQARVLLERAAALDPTYPEAWRDLAVVRLRLSDNLGAKMAAERFARLSPGDEARALLGYID
jgi:tetratricopeptide (TPR) repeat protein